MQQNPTAPVAGLVKKGPAMCLGQVRDTHALNRVHDLVRGRAVVRIGRVGINDTGVEYMDMASPGFDFDHTDVVGVVAVLTVALDEIADLVHGGES